MRIRRSLVIAAVAGGSLLCSALPAGAHPFFTDGATVPASSLGTLTLAMAHGCGTESEGGGDPTTEISIEVPEQVAYLLPQEVEGYEVSLEGDEGAVPDVVTWTAIDEGEPAPELTMDLVVDGDEGDELFVRVFQGCDGFEYRWIGTPDEPADDPAVGLTLAAEDPDSPPPVGEPEEAPTDAPDVDEPVSEDPVDGDADGDDADDGAPTADDPASDDQALEDPPPAVDELPTEPPADEGSGPLPVWAIVVGAIALAGIGALAGTALARRRRPQDPAAGPSAG
jgi:uncharacterized protein YcnI